MARAPLLKGVLMLLTVCPTVIVQAAEKVSSILEVKTHGDLENVAPLQLKNGTKVRLGVERLQYPVGDGVLLYCLTEGYQPPDTWGRADLMGPIIVVLQKSREPGLVVKLRSTSDDGKHETVLVLQKGFGWSANQQQERGLDQCRLLFVRPVFVDRVGKLPIQIYEHLANGESEDEEVGRLLAECTLIGTDQAYQPWMPFDVKHLKGQDSGETAVTVTNRPNGIGLPWLPDMRPTVVKGLVKGQIKQWEPKNRLPKLIPSEPTDSLKCSIKGDLLTIDSNVGMRDAGGFAYHFLARWWVNDKPFDTKQLSVTERSGPDGVYGSLEPVQRLQVKLNVNRKALQAKAGDRIDVQLLFCPDGWDWVDSSRSSIGKGWNGNNWPIMSNRIEVIAD